MDWSNSVKLDHVFFAFDDLSHYMAYVLQQKEDGLVKLCESSQSRGLTEK